MDETTYTPPPPQPPPPPAPPPRVLRRRDGHLGGVAAGVGHYLDVDPNLVRLAFVLLSFVGGSGIFLYLAGWILLPTAAEDPSSQPVTLRTDSATAVVGAFVLGLAALVLLGQFDRDGGLLLPLLLVGLGAWLLSQRPNPGPQPAVPGAQPGAGPTGSAHRAPAPPVAAQPGTTQPGTTQPGTAPGTAEAWSRSSTELERYPAPAIEGPGHFHWEPRQEGAGSDDTAVAPPPPPPPPGAAPGWAVPHGPGEPARTTPAGPPITSITLAVLAVTVGVLLVLESVGAIELTALAVAATSVVVIGCGLLASAFLGRARGLIPLGLVAVLGLAVAPGADLALDGGVDDRVIRVADTGDVEDRYRLGIGSLLVDLRGVDPDELDTEVEVTVGIGVAEVIVPEGVRVEVEGRSAAGYVELFGRERDGMGASLEVADGPVGDDVLVLDANARVGAVVVRRG